MQTRHSCMKRSTPRHAYTAAREKCSQPVVEDFEHAAGPHQPKVAQKRRALLHVCVAVCLLVSRLAVALFVTTAESFLAAAAAASALVAAAAVATAAAFAFPVPPPRCARPRRLALRWRAFVSQRGAHLQQERQRDLPSGRTRAAWP
eukprot:350323-Chlamydomonas_euryale.AAC.3